MEPAERRAYWRGELPVRYKGRFDASGNSYGNGVQILGDLEVPPLPGVRLSDSAETAVVHTGIMRAGDVLLFSACTWHKSPPHDPDRTVMVLQPAFAPSSARITEHNKRYRWGDCFVNSSIGSLLTESPGCFPQAYPRVQHGQSIVGQRVVACDWGSLDASSGAGICQNAPP
eukprot:gnl/TRDRNA2_/TRDRNA2_206211_c0_seq1.p1 gnl/TRDRNA2_/TRDRNA2_206211_c0~~gnl/TRDRNA2_/TRDRNA2_206211_c0_seq1.p1  ORF type:complete len:172 (-),score=11.12 gnl/TRDRNA2_/TRDRNA2_206211_c0_seq1:527-1042(-)